MSTKTGTIGGVLAVVLANITSSDIIKTGVLAAVGAIVSYLATLLVKKLVKDKSRNT